MSKKIETTLTLFDNEKNRKKSPCLSPIEIMADDSDNIGSFSFFEALDDFIEFGKTYKITIEEVK